MIVLLVAPCKALVLLYRLVYVSAPYNMTTTLTATFLFMTQPQSTKDRRQELLKQSMMRPSNGGMGGNMGGSQVLSAFSKRKAAAEAADVMVVSPGRERDSARGSEGQSDKGRYVNDNGL